MIGLPAQHLRLSPLSRILLSAALLGCFGALQISAQPQAADSTTYSVPILVSDFELHSVSPQPKPPVRPPTASEKEKPKVPLVYEDTDLPSAQARREIDFFAATLVQTLEKKGFQARRARGSNPPAGALIRGVFAEPDALNRIRRALLGGGSPSARFLLYVGVFNLARQEQPLYLPATDQPPSQGYGPIITLNNYILLAKYELDKNPTEEDVQKICNQIAASLATLLESNPNAFSH